MRFSPGEARGISLVGGLRFRSVAIAAAAALSVSISVTRSRAAAIAASWALSAVVRRLAVIRTI